jgi:tRNA(adenine34) deaminase
MCAGTILLSRLKEINYANSSPKFGAVESKINLFESAEWNHQVEVKLAPAATTEASARILKNYFAAKRKSN